MGGDSDPIRAAAVHEAGHAVAYLRFDRELAHVAIGGDGTGEAVLTEGWRPHLDLVPCRRERWAQREAWIELVCAYAGPVAEGRLVGFDVEPTCIVVPAHLKGETLGSVSDLHRARDLAHAMWPRSAAARAERALASARHLMRGRARCRAVEAIAAALVKHGRIDGAAARAIFEAKTMAAP